MASSETNLPPPVLIHRLSVIDLTYNTWLPTLKFLLLDPTDPSFSSSPEAQGWPSRPGPSSASARHRSPRPHSIGTHRSSASWPPVWASTVDLPECRRRGIAVTNAGDAFSADMADIAVALLIDVLRRVSAGSRFVRAGSWPGKGEYPLASKLGGKQIGIVGLGSISSMVAKRLEAFGCSIAYNSRTKKPHVPFPFYENVHDLATNSDVLIICCALTDETHHIINKDVMIALGKEGVIVNVGRGFLINEKELVQFLVRGDIGGAGLDVYENEPVVPRELFELDNVVLSPHRAVATEEAILAMQEVVMVNLEAFFANKPFVSEVKLE